MTSVPKIRLTIIALAQSQTLEDVIYKSYTGNPCVWLVNSEGGVGCHSKNGVRLVLNLKAPRSGVVGVMHYVETSAELTQFLTAEKQDPRVLVMPVTLLANKKLVALMESNKTEEARVIGVLVLDGDELPSEPFSPALVSSVCDFFSFNRKTLILQAKEASSGIPQLMA